MTQPTNALQALENLARAAEQLSRLWPSGGELDNALTDFYPDYLPSFDQTALDFSLWFQRANAKTQEPPPAQEPNEQEPQPDDSTEFEPHEEHGGEA